MSDLIGCRSCDAPSCNGCNIYTLAKALEAGRFKYLTDDKHCVHIAADVKPIVKGEWTDFSTSIKGVPTEACGVCGEWSLGIGKNFCPNCGADMRGDEE